MRYYEGLAPRHIAARLGVPAKTVKTRLARGLEQLRDRGMELSVPYVEAWDEAERAAWDALSDAILAHLEKQQGIYVAGSSQAELDEARAWAADIDDLTKIFRIYADRDGEVPNVRDRCMAENVRWVLEQEGPDARLMLWAHNLHVHHLPATYGRGTTGSDLVHLFGDDYIAFGFSFREGSFQAIYYPQGAEEDDGGPRLREHTIDPAPEGFVGHAFAAAGMPRLIVDLRAVEEDTPAHAWLTAEHRMRSIGAAYAASIEQWLAHDLVLPDAYDAIIYIEQTTRARPCARTKERYPPSSSSE